MLIRFSRKPTCDRQIDGQDKQTVEHSTTAYTALARLWFLEILKRAGVPQSDIVCYYEVVIRPVME